MLTALCILFGTLEAGAQDIRPRFGVGLNGMVSTADGLGVGLRGRVSAPINADLSLAVDAGFTGFVLRGRDDANYVFDPQISAIVSIPRDMDQLVYLLFGGGAYVPIAGEGNSVSGPTLHVGVGWVRALTETSLYYEVDPALVIGENSVDLVIPIRVGVIF